MSQFQDSQDPWSYYFNPNDLENLEKLEQFHKEKKKLENMFWWKQVG